MKKLYMLRLSPLGLAIVAGLAVTGVCGPKGDTARNDQAPAKVQAS